MVSFIRIVLIVVVSFNTTLSYADEHDEIGPELESELVLSLEFESVRHALNEEQASLSVGYAVGSGTEAGQAEGSGTFQQTGLNSNELDTHYYGAILEPQLSNLHVATVQLQGTVGVIPGQYQIAHHRYFTDSTADGTFEAEYEWLSAARNRKLGNETSIGYAVEIVDGFEFKATLARLRMNTLADRQRDKSIEYAQVLISYEF